MANMNTKLPISLSIVVLAFSISLAQVNPITINQSETAGAETWNNMANESFFNKTKSLVGMTGQNVLSKETDNNSSKSLSNTQDEMNNDQSSPSIFRRIGLSLAVTCVVSVVFPIGFLFILCCLGFTCKGVRASSYASHRQSAIGNVSSKSCFARMQSTGAGGRFLTLFVIGLMIGVVSGIVSGIYGWPDI